MHRGWFFWDRLGESEREKEEDRTGGGRETGRERK